MGRGMIDSKNGCILGRTTHICLLWVIAAIMIKLMVVLLYKKLIPILTVSQVLYPPLVVDKKKRRNGP